MEEIFAPWLEGSQEIINHWDSFNRGESPVTHLDQLNLVMLRMPVEVWTKRKGEKYVISIPAYACKEDFKQVVEDGMLICNRNFVQSTERVHLQLLCTILVSLLSHCFILRCSFIGYYGYPKHDLLASRVPYSIEGCVEVAALRLIDRF